jgi:hypothetical protein
MLGLESYTTINMLLLWAAAGSLCTNACQLKVLAVTAVTVYEVLPVRSQ